MRSYTESTVKKLAAAIAQLLQTALSYAPSLELSKTKQAKSKGTVQYEKQIWQEQATNRKASVGPSVSQYLV